ncbi:MAG: rod shape-determining protein MreC [Gemmatimonadota bacterium]|nr:rod shape-determining protein MreC [Gemmatimonadota bacterium]
MARAARFSTRIDLAAFGSLIILALIAAAAPATMREPVARVMRRTVVVPLVGLQRGAERWRAAWLASERETAQRDSLALRAFEVPVLQSENQRLRRLLGLGSRLDWGFVPADAIHAPNRPDPLDLILTAGSNAGVDPNSPVVAPEGLVGVVLTVDPTQSVAMTFTNKDFAVSAMTADGSAFGIVYPHLSAGANRPERYLLELRGVPFRNTVPTNTLVYTSGLGGRYPRGIPVGTVIREMQTPESWARTYLVRPAVNPAEVANVMILYPRRAAEGVENVWRMGTATDSAIRGVAAAGDSMARADSAAVLAVRRRALDSLARAGLPLTDTAPVAAPRLQPTQSAPIRPIRPPARAGATTTGVPPRPAEPPPAPPRR